MRFSHLLFLGALSAINCLPQASSSLDQNLELAFTPQDSTVSNNVNSHGPGCAHSDKTIDQDSSHSKFFQSNLVASLSPALPSPDEYMEANMISPRSTHHLPFALPLSGPAIPDETTDSFIALKPPDKTAPDDACSVDSTQPNSIISPEEEPEEKREIVCSGLYVFKLCCHSNYSERDGRIEECFECKSMSSSLFLCDFSSFFSPLNYINSNFVLAPPPLWFGAWTTTMFELNWCLIFYGQGIGHVSL